MKKERFDPYSNYYYKENIKKNRKAKFLTLLFVVLSISIVIFFSISFSNFLTISKIVNVNSNYIFEDKTLYGLSLKTTNNFNDAEAESDNIKQQGGAGFILNNGANEFKIISSIYSTEKDAKSVKSNLSNNGIDSEIVKIKLPAFNFKVNLSTKSTQVLSNGINIFFTSYKKLYDLSVDYDSKKIDYTNLKTSLNNLYNDNKEIIKEYNLNFTNSSNIYILYVKIYLNKVNDIISKLQIKDESYNLSSEIKYAYCNVLNFYLDLYNEML